MARALCGVQGDGVGKDEARAVAYYQRAAEIGVAQVRRSGAAAQREPAAEGAASSRRGSGWWRVNRDWGQPTCAPRDHGRCSESTGTRSPAA